MSRTSLGQRNENKMIRSNIGSGLNLTNQLSSKRYTMQFPIETHINLMDQLNTLHILDKYIKYAQQSKGQVQSYRGDTKNGKKEGFGTYTFKNNDQYTGYWDKDKMHAMGIYQYDSTYTKNRYVYVGEFSQGKFNGTGKLVLLKNDRQGFVVYQGFWKNGQKNGFGIYFYELDTTNYYEGYWQNDMKHGQGRLIFKNGQYHGLWKNDKRHGEGTLKVQKSNQTLIYNGEWNNDELHEGEITYLSQPNSTNLGTYKGKIKNLKKDGKGTFQYNKIFMEGLFENDYFIGKGTLYNDQYRLEGDFHSSKNNLNGSIKYPNGDIFQGIIDISTGIIKRKQGKYKFVSGDLADGKFDDKGSGQLIGFFDYIWHNGQRKKYNN